MTTKIPETCDFDCPHADFAPADTAGICRTMSAVWCRQLKRLVSKNAKCAFREQERRGGSEKSKTRSTKSDASRQKPG